MKNLIANLVRLGIKSPFIVKTALLHLTVLTTLVFMFNKQNSRRILPPITLEERAERLYPTLIAVAEKPQMVEIMKQELRGQERREKQIIINYFFYRAVREKLFDKAEIFFAQGGNPDCDLVSSETGETLLMDCTQSGSCDQVQFLLDHRANPRRYNSDGYPALFFLLKQPDKKECIGMLEAFAQVISVDYPRQPDCVQMQLLFLAAQEEKFFLVKQLLKLGADPNFRYSQDVDWTVTKFAAFRMKRRYGTGCGKWAGKGKQRDQIYYPMTKLLYFYGGMPKEGKEDWFSAQEIAEFEPEKKQFDVFKQDQACIARIFSQDRRPVQKQSYQEKYQGVLLTLLQDHALPVTQDHALPVTQDHALPVTQDHALPVTQVAQIVCDYHDPYPGLEDWAWKDDVNPERVPEKPRITQSFMRGQGYHDEGENCDFCEAVYREGDYQLLSREEELLGDREHGGITRAPIEGEENRESCDGDSGSDRGAGDGGDGGSCGDDARE